MIRYGLTELALFATPFVLYAVFLLATRTGVMDPKAWPPARLVWLAAAAVGLMLGSFVYLANFGGAPVGSTYIPAHMENGKFVPGTVK